MLSMATSSQRAHVVCSYDDYDITENTLLDSELLPLHFEQVKAAIMVHGKQSRLLHSLPVALLTYLTSADHDQMFIRVELAMRNTQSR